MNGEVVGNLALTARAASCRASNWHFHYILVQVVDAVLSELNHLYLRRNIFDVLTNLQIIAIQSGGL